MRIPWFKNKRYKEQYRAMDDARNSSPRYKFALWPRSTNGVLVWFEPYLRVLDGRDMFGCREWIRELPGIRTSSDWRQDVPSLMRRDETFYNTCTTTEEFQWWPKTCEFSGGLIWFQKCVVLSSTGHRSGILDQRYVERIVMCDLVLKGTWTK